MIRLLIVSVIISFSTILTSIDSALAFVVTSNTERNFEGFDNLIGVRLSASLNPSDKTIIRITIDKDIMVNSDIDYANKNFLIEVRKIQSNRKSVVTQLSEKNIRAIQALQLQMIYPNGLLGDSITSFLEYMAQAPTGHTISIDRQSETAHTSAAAPGIISLCKVSKATARYYNEDDKRISKKVAVGSCYNTSNKCFGRCGRGCESNPGNPKVVQRFTQDCLNHDFCTREEGEIFGQCSAEWLLAADDFLFANDCANVDGSWDSISGSSWNLEQSPIFTISGENYDPFCGLYKVTGTHSLNKLDLTGKTSTPREGCCASAKFSSVMATCDLAIGSYKNSCGVKGSFILFRSTGKMTVNTDNINQSMFRDLR